MGTRSRRCCWGLDRVSSLRLSLDHARRAHTNMHYTREGGVAPQTQLSSHLAHPDWPVEHLKPRMRHRVFRQRTAPDIAEFLGFIDLVCEVNNFAMELSRCLQPRSRRTALLVSVEAALCDLFRVGLLWRAR